MGSLFDLIKLVVPGSSLWHDGFKFGVICERDGSWWTVDAHGSSAWKFPVRNADEALEVFGSLTASDDAWTLR